QRRQHQEPRLAGLGELLGEGADLGVDETRQLADAAFLAGIAGDRIGMAVDRNRHLCHQPSNTRSRRPITASSRAATPSVVSASAAYSAFAALSPSTCRRA